MVEPWYRAVPAEEALSQGDLIMRCPLLTWKLVDTGSSDDPESPEILTQAIAPIRADVIVLTQVCDLENRKVTNVVLSPHFALDQYRKAWEAAEQERGQNVSERSWRRHCDEIEKQSFPNLAMLNGGDVGGQSIGIRIVDFHEVYTAPRAFIESLLRRRGQPRLRLNDMYRVNVPHRFGNYFMRPGLPTPIDKAW